MASEGKQSLKSQKKYWPFAIIIGFSIILILFFFFDWWPALRGGYGWRWPYERPESSHLVRILPAVLAIVLYLIGVRRLGNASAIAYVIWCIIGAIFIPVALLFWWGDPLELLFTRTVSGLITGGFTVAAKMEGLQPTLQQWPSTMGALKSESVHIALSMPGWPIIYYGLTKLLAAYPGVSEILGMGLRPFLCHNVPIMNLSNAQLASSWFGIAAPLWAALTIVPLYFLGRAAADESTARKAIAWWPLVPSLAMFLGTLNSPTPLLSMTIVYFLWGGLSETGRGVNWRLVLAGILTAVAITLTFAFAPLILFAGLLALVTWQRDEQLSWVLDLRKPVMAGLQFGIGLLLVFAIYTVIGRHTPIQILANSMANHLDLKRKYWPWLGLHAWDFILFVGLPAFGLFIMGMTRWGRKSIRQLAATLSLTLIIVILSGTARGETGRLWLFFMPVLLLVAADVLVKLPRSLRYGLVATQAFWLLVLFTILPTTGRGYSAPPAYADVAFAPGEGNVVATDVNFDNLLQLDGYGAKYDASENAFVIDLHWRAQQQLADAYFFSALLVGPEGPVLPAKDWQPFDYQYPTTCWPADGEPLVDRIKLPLGENEAAGEYWLSLAVFQINEEGEMVRLPVLSAEGGEDIQVGLGPLRSE